MPTAGTSELLATLAQPTSAYRRRAWLAVVGLAVFVALYFALAVWFMLTAWNLTFGAGSRNTVLGIMVGACAAILAVFMLKAVFFVRRGGQSNDIELKPGEQPRLFEFLHRLADQAGAPRPYRVFVSPRVNAAVFYDLSLLNLLLPSRKNLEIGLALVNSLSLGELRAVLAHEFGHFTQGTMAIGRWVYMAQQIAAHLVARRDKLDEVLIGLSRLDLRVAWIGWGLQIVVWSIRSLVETLFGWVVVMQRALSREMEMQADLIAVSLTGSDALIHALHRLEAADDAWNRTLGFVQGENAAKRTPRDAFAVQSRVLERMGTLLNDPTYGRVPPLPAEQPEAHRVFKAELAQPPQMWLTHPLNHEREANAKRRYVPAPIDERSAWELFEDAATLREKATASLVGKAQSDPVPLAETLQALDAQFERHHLAGRYRGIYLNRPLTRSAVSVDALYDAEPEAAPRQIGALYPPSLNEQVERMRTLEKDLGQLRALQSGALNPSGGVLRYRGKELKLARLPQAIGELEAEIREVEERLRAHDRLCRSAHLAAARAVGNGWPEYLRGLLAALHYAEHTEANLRDAQGLLANTYAIVTATRKVSNAGANRMVDSANMVYAALAKIDAQRSQVALDAALLEKLKAASWSEAVGELKLPPASRTNIGDWLKYVDGWIGQFAGAAGALRTHALESLLLAEDKVAAAARDGVALEAAPEAARLPESFDLLLPGAERKRQARLDWWARFQTAEGMVPAAARFAVAGGIVAAALGLGGAVGSATVTIYNGLARPVIIELNGEKLGVAAFGSARRELESNRKYRIDARSLDGQPIESFDADVRGRFASYVYSVAGAAALVEWTATYGKVEGRADRNLGAPRWITNSADMMFAEPPRSVQTSRGSAGTTREVLTGLGNSSPQHQLSLVSGEADQKRLIALHARWDQSDSPYIHEWLSIAMQMPEHRGVLGLRLKESPDDVIFLRAEQDSATGAERETVCARHRARAEAAPQSPDLQYLAVRCLPEKEKSQQFLSGYGKWPDHGWFAYAAGYSYAEAARWREAIKAMDLARAKVPSVVDNLNVDLMRIHRLQMNAAQFKALKSMLLAEPVAKSFRIEDLQQAREQKDAAAPLRPFIELAKKSDALRQLVTLESGEGLAGSDFAAYSELARGNLDKAMRLVQGNTERRVRLLRLAAASDGASRDLVSAALALNSDDGIDESTVWAALALAMREKRETAPYLAQVGKNPRERAEVVVRFLEALQRGQPPAATERLLDGVQPSLRGHGYSGGVVLLGEKAPRAWRDAANRLLFASERPYFN